MTFGWKEAFTNFLIFRLVVLAHTTVHWLQVRQLLWRETPIQLFEAGSLLKYCLLLIAWTLHLRMRILHDCVDWFSTGLGLGWMQLLLVFFDSRTGFLSQKSLLRSLLFSQAVPLNSKGLAAIVRVLHRYSWLHFV